MARPKALFVQVSYALEADIRPKVTGGVDSLRAAVLVGYLGYVTKGGWYTDARAALADGLFGVSGRTAQRYVCWLVEHGYLEQRASDGALRVASGWRVTGKGSVPDVEEPEEEDDTDGRRMVL